MWTQSNFRHQPPSSLLRVAVGTILVGIIAAGCSVPRPRVSVYVTNLSGTELPSRIVVVPFSAPTGAEDASSTVTQAFALEIQRILHCDVVVAPEDDERLRAETAMWKRGRVDVDALVDARKRYLPDAFLFGEVTQYKPYDPPILGVHLRLLDARSGEVTWAAGGLFDGRDADVRWLGEKYYRNSGLSEGLYGPEVIFMSTRLYSGFVAGQVLAPLDDYVRSAEGTGRDAPKTASEPPSTRQ